MLRPASVPGEARFTPSKRTLAVLENVALGVMSGEQRIDAIYDPGAVYCIIPRRTASRLGFNERNRRGRVPTDVVGGHEEYMDRHAMEYVRVGTAMDSHVPFLIGEINYQRKSMMLLGLSFMEEFDTTTLDFAGRSVLFRPGGQTT